MEFMSIEVAAERFLFFPPEPGPSSSDLDEFLSALKQGVRRPRGARTEVSFSHNHLHDLESLWWVAVWVVFYSYFSEGTSFRDRPSSTLRDTGDQLKLARILFPHALNNSDRRDAF